MSHKHKKVRLNSFILNKIHKLHFVNFHAALNLMNHNKTHNKYLYRNGREQKH